MLADLAEDQLENNPWRPRFCAITEEPDIFVGDAGGWTEDGRELPRDKVKTGRAKELRSWHNFTVVTQILPSEIPEGALIYCTRFLYRMKGNDVKARIVVQQLRKRTQVAWVDVFAACPTLAANRLLLWKALSCNWPVVEGDVSTAFLHAPLPSDLVIVLRPPVEVDQGYVWLLHHAAYGLRQAPRLWQDWYASCVEKLGFSRSPSDPQLFVRFNDGSMITTHADDIRLTASEDNIEEIQHQLSELMVIKWINRMSDQWNPFLGCLWRRLDDRHVQMKPQEIHIQKILENMDVAHGKGVASPKWSPQSEKLVAEPLDNAQSARFMSTVGSLQWIALSRADVQFVAKELARSLAKPTTNDMARLKKLHDILRELSR